MARNDRRRGELADAGIRVLATEGARGLTHRAVDAAAEAPRGTASNYFPTRGDLIAALVARIEERLTPAAAAHGSGSGRAPDRAAFAEHVRDVVRRLSEDPHVPLALFELRLEASRRPEVAEALGAWRRSAFADDVAFNEAAGLPGARADLALVHYAIDGLMLDRLTTPLDPATPTDAIVDALVERILPVSTPDAAR
ncbi:TetR/AcrR family transcriptional regulator [Agrococcus sp. BE272]|uniref:TetR/AcrR family transcriptional regulator n=1 Tax=Agrococcus sp. BE272 TaxID=2817727 RepID=UPI00285E38F7|nr:TetR/AcrR family transcriptional regulator [Agrococcus sp. BE272]MDR7235353.1 DNA-binding transcriptional regulator YbjK [Agrococcus sp. BE272]